MRLHGMAEYAEKLKMENLVVTEVFQYFKNIFSLGFLQPF